MPQTEVRRYICFFIAQLISATILILLIKQLKYEVLSPEPGKMKLENLGRKNVGAIE